MAVRKIVHIDEELCDGCGDCVPSCAEGAIQIIDGKARLLADNLCDGLGACLGECPQGAITVEEREADEFDEAAVEAHLGHKPAHDAPAAAPAGPLNVLGPVTPAPASRPAATPGGCPGSRAMQFAPAAAAAPAGQAAAAQASELRQWPVQLHLVNPGAPYFQGAQVLLAADCCAFASGDFHGRFLKGKTLAVACPKLDQGQEIYLQKLVAMIDHSLIDTLTVLVMEVPCCTGLSALARRAADAATRKVPVKEIVLSVQGQVIREQWM